VLLIGYERRAHDFSRVTRRVTHEGTAAANGAVRLNAPPGYQIVPNSFWVAIDLTSGDYGAATGDGRKLREGEFASNNIEKDTAGRRKKILSRFDYVYMLLVRPGAGVWDATAGDGGPSDGDGEVNGQIDLAVERLTNRDTGVQDVGECHEGDLLLVFVPSQMGYVLTGVSQ
jgi:hypothetical protein